MISTVGFIGQGWIGKNYADNFEARGFESVCYGLESEYIANKDKIAECDIVCIAVPTPSTPEGFSLEHVRSALALVGKKKTVVVKSTLACGSTEQLQKDFPELYIFHVPEFLREAYARYDVDNPHRLFIGIPTKYVTNQTYVERAELIKDIMPEASYTRILASHEAEFLKYTHNTIGYSTVLFTNMLYELGRSLDVEWDLVREAILNNPWFPEKYLSPGHQGGRGAGGDCFIKDFAAFTEMYKERISGDPSGVALLNAMVRKNNQLLRSTEKSINLLNSVYGKDAGKE